MIDTSQFKSLAFQYPFRRYQNMILKQIEESSEDDRYHIVAPPGSGKTIVGIELIKRLEAPAVVFVPTTTIQMQWREKVAMFIPKNSELTLDDLVSLDPNNLKPINVFTYQLISSTGGNLDFVEKAAQQEWVNDLIVHTIVETEAEAFSRIATIQANNSKQYNRDLSKYYKRVKKHLLETPDVDRTLSRTTKDTTTSISTMLNLKILKSLVRHFGN